MYLTRDVEPQGQKLEQLLKRSALDREAVRETVRGVLEEVRAHGDAALFAFEKRFDKAELSSLKVSAEELSEAEKQVSP